MEIGPHLDELEAMDEWRRLANVRQFSLSVEIFRSNASELTHLLNSVNRPEDTIRLWALANRPGLALRQQEIARIFHNFVASAKSLVDHSRVFVRTQYQENANFQDYDAEVKKRFEDDPMIQFVHGLRNYYLHVRVPDFVTRLNWSQGEVDHHSALLKTSELRGGWMNPVAKGYMDDKGAEIDLCAVLNEYTASIEAFYTWMFSRLDKIHSKDQCAIASKQRELREAAGPMVHSLLASVIRDEAGHQSRPEQVFLGLLSTDCWHDICDKQQAPEARANAFLDVVAEHYAYDLDDLRTDCVALFEKCSGCP